MKYSELEKMLKSAGCTIFREGKKHCQWKSPAGKLFSVGRHKTEEVPIGTLKAILKDAGLE